jgi:Cu2+-exporting ATPase
VAADAEDYYSHRRETAVTADVVPEIIGKLRFYDDPEVQQSFVRARAELKEVALVLENIRCAACLWLNEQVLRGLDGVLDVELDYASHHARVRWDPQRIRLSEILESIIGIGYLAHPYDPARRAALEAEQRRRSTERLLFAGVIGMLIMQFAIAGYVMGHADETGELSLWTRIGRWTSLFATTILLAYSGQEFLLGAWRDLSHRKLGMDVPIVLGLGIAYIGSLHTTWTLQGEVYYDSIAMFVFLVLLARRFELGGRIQAANALDRVGRIIPRVAKLVAAEGIRTVLVSDLRPGDRVRLLPGEVIPTDGILCSGASGVDESMLTGEATPVTKHPGEPLLGGACIVDQAIEMQVSRASNDSTLADIQRLLGRGMREMPRYAALAQRIAIWFVAIVLGIAATTGAFWLWVDPGSVLPNTVAVLIVTCPCALALATPVASAISAGRFADLGVLPLRADAIEQFADCDSFVFDKTGTLSQGKLTVETIATPGRINAHEARQIAAALERHSEHPVAKAIAAAGDGTRAADVTMNYPGQGVSGRIEDKTWRLGNPGFALQDCPVDAAEKAQIRQMQESGLLVVVLADATGTQAVFGLRDQPRPGIRALLAGLRHHGVRHITLLSGDSQANVKRFAQPFDIDLALGDQRPDDKLTWLDAERRQGRRIAMIGDGINDAPTLAAADVSISFAHASDLAQIHSDMLLLGDRLGNLLEMRRLAQANRRIIKQNLAWAFGYNLLAVPAAAAGWVPPWGAAIGMSLSSLLVVGNALRLRGAKR